MGDSRILSSGITRFNQAAADFLRIDSQVGLTLSNIALAATDKEKRIRTTKAARKAYDTIARLRDSVVLTYAENTKLDHNMQHLKNELQSLGQVFDEDVCPY